LIYRFKYVAEGKKRCDIDSAPQELAEGQQISFTYAVKFDLKPAKNS
jgi:hypothetical protein